MKQSLISQLQVLLDFMRFIALRFRQDRCAQMAASLTFTTLLSLVPLLTIALTLFSAFPVFADFSSHIKEFALTNLMPETGGKMITRYMEQFAESAAKLTAMGIVFLALTAMLMMLTIDNAFNTIWRVTVQRSPMQRVLIYWAVLTLAPLLIGGSLSLTSWLIGLSIGYAKQMSALGVLLLKVVPVILTSLAFSLLFRVVPNRYVPLRHAIVGGIVAAAMFESMNQVFAFYISHFGTYKLVYGAFASIPIFLMWIYLSWFAVLVGALITAVLPHWRSRYSLNVNPVTRFYYAVSMLEVMHEGRKSGQVATLYSLARRLRLGYDDAEKMLDALERANMVGKLSGRGWTLIRDPQHIAVGELAELFLLDVGKLPDEAQQGKVKIWLNQVETQLAFSKRMTLQELWDMA